MTGPQQEHYIANNMATKEYNPFENYFGPGDFNFSSTDFDSELQKLVESSEPDTQTLLGNAECLFDINPEAPNAEAQEIKSLRETIGDLKQRVEILERYLNSSATSRNMSLTVHCSLLAPRDKWERDLSSWANSVNKLLGGVMEEKTSEPDLCGDQLVGIEQWVDMLCDYPAPTQTH